MNHVLVQLGGDDDQNVLNKQLDLEDAVIVSHCFHHLWILSLYVDVNNMNCCRMHYFYFFGPDMTL